MSRTLIRAALGIFVLGVLFASIATTAAQAPPAKQADPLAEYRRLLKAPTKDSTASQFWGAIAFEMELGSYEIAARFLHSLLAVKKPTDEELVTLEREIGMASLLRLRNVVRWSNDRVTNDQAVADVETLISQTTAAVRNHLSDPVRIKKYLALLSGSPEEETFALQQLYQSGAAIVPPILAEIQQGDPDRRTVLLRALRRMGAEVIPPLVAALDSADALLKVDLIDLFVARAARQVTPSLWYVAAAPSQPESVRERARTALGLFRLSADELQGPPAARGRALARAITQLPSAKVALTEEAERYYRHGVPFADPRAVTVWRWDGKSVVAGWPGAPTVSASKAEEYYGLRFAGEALALDPTYQPAQVLLVSLVLDKTYEQGGYDRPLAVAAPPLHALLASINPDVLIPVLERAIDDKRLPVILATTRMLGEAAEVRALRPTEQGESPLGRALLYPDRRVQMAAAEALLRVPGERTGLVAGRIVDVLRRALAAEITGGPKVLFGYVNDEYANRVGDALKLAGFDPIRVKDGRKLLERLFEASDIEAVLFDADLPGPGLAALLGQIRGDVHVRQIPVFITPSHFQEDRLIAELKTLDDALKDPPPGARIAQQLRRDQVEAQLKLQSLASMAAIERFSRVYRHVEPLTASSAVNAIDLRSALQPQLSAAVNPPLAEAELRDYAERSVRYLSRAARGELGALDVTPAADTVMRALTAKKLSPEGQIAAIEVIARLPGKRPQSELLHAALDEKRPPMTRLAAAAELVRHIQRNGPALSDAEAQSIRNAHDKTADPAIRAALGQVVGALRPDARTTGDALRGFTPPPPVPPPPIPMPDK